MAYAQWLAIASAPSGIGPTTFRALAPGLSTTCAFAATGLRFQAELSCHAYMSSPIGRRVRWGTYKTARRFAPSDGQEACSEIAVNKVLIPHKFGARGFAVSVNRDAPDLARIHFDVDGCHQYSFSLSRRQLIRLFSALGRVLKEAPAGNNRVKSMATRRRTSPMVSDLAGRSHRV